MPAVGLSKGAATTSRGLRFCLLGPLEAYRDGAQLELGPRKQRAVLALLLLNANRVVSTERLIDELWGEAPPNTARAALQVYVAGLRKALGSDGATLRTSAPGYVLELEPGTLDLDRFVELRAEARAAADDERRSALLQEALALWRDTPLVELSAEPFATAAVAQLEELRLEALEERIEADLALGRQASLLRELEALVSEHPYRERLRALLMVALYRSGRQAEALEAYQLGRRALSDELGLVPGKELRDLEAAILRQDEALLPDGRGPVEGLPDAGPPVQGRRRRRGRPALLLVALLGVAAAATAAVLARGEPAPIAVPPNSLAAIDPETNRVVAIVPVGIRPGPVAVGAASIWVGNLVDKSLMRVDPRARRVVRTIPLDATPTAIAFGARSVWVAHGLSGDVSRVDPGSNRVAEKLDLGGRPIYFSSAGVAVGEGSIWAVFGDSRIVRVSHAAGSEPQSGLTGLGPAGVAAGEDGSIWVANSGDSTLQRFDPATFKEGPVQMRTVGGTPTAVAAGEGAVWVTGAGDDVVTRFDPGAGSGLTIGVGERPVAVAVGARGVWVANRGSRSVSRIDPETNDVVRTIDVGAAPAGIAVEGSLVWIAVQVP